MTILFLIGGTVLLIVGAELLVRGASNLAARMGIPSLIIGLTVVAFGTSSPEFAVSLKAAMSGNANIALGNVVGSNIFNVLFILGISASIVPLLVSRQLIRIDVPIMIGASLASYAMAADGTIHRLEGLILFVGLIIYTGLLIHFGRKNSEAQEGPKDEFILRYSWPRNLTYIALGLTMLAMGSQFLVTSAVAIAQHFGVSDLIIGLTIIAAGTSLPEVVTSIVASMRGERDIAVGNVVGSNTFNLLGVLGLSAVLAPTGIDVTPSALRFDIPVMVAVALVCLPIFITGKTIARWEGFLLLIYYFAYTFYLILDAKGHDSLPAFSLALQYVVMPLTIATMVIMAIKK